MPCFLPSFLGLCGQRPRRRRRPGQASWKGRAAAAAAAPPRLSLSPLSSIPPPQPPQDDSRDHEMLPCRFCVASCKVTRSVKVTRSTNHTVPSVFIATMWSAAAAAWPAAGVSRVRVAARDRPSLEVEVGCGLNCRPLSLSLRRPFSERGVVIKEERVHKVRVLLPHPRLSSASKHAVKQCNLAGIIHLAAQRPRG